MISIKKLDEAYIECMDRLYRQANPPTTYKQLMDSGEGHQERFFMNYEIDADKMNDIISDIIKEYKIKPKYVAGLFRASVHTGGSPKTK